MTAVATLPTWPSVLVGGQMITACAMDEVADILALAMAQRSQPMQLATVNLNFLRRAAEDAELRAVLDRCAHRFADGWPVVELAAKTGVRLPGRVTGSDLTLRICAWAATRGWRLGFIGGQAGCDAVAQRRFGCVVSQWIPTYASSRAADIEDPALAAAVRAAGCDILLVGLGCPKQEHWLDRNLAATGAAVGMGVGASLDFLSGHVTRAPRLWQRLRLEFFWRLCQEPRRLGRRYYDDWLYYRTLKRQS